MAETNKDSFFSEKGILNTHENLQEDTLRVEKKRWKILEYIQNNPNSTIYAIAKGTNTNYSQMHQIVRELLFVRLIASNKKKSENGEWYDVYYIPIKKEDGSNAGC